MSDRFGSVDRCTCGPAWDGEGPNVDRDCPAHGIVSDPGLWTKRAHSTGRFARLRQFRDAFKGVRREN